MSPCDSLHKGIKLTKIVQLIMQLLRDNLTLWTSDLAENAPPANAGAPGADSVAAEKKDDAPAAAAAVEGETAQA